MDRQPDGVKDCRLSIQGVERPVPEETRPRTRPPLRRVLQNTSLGPVPTRDPDRTAKARNAVGGSRATMDGSSFERQRRLHYDMQSAVGTDQQREVCVGGIGRSRSLGHVEDPMRIVEESVHPKNLSAVLGGV